MKKFDENKYFAVKRELDERFPYEYCKYENGTIARGFAYGREDELTEDKLRKQLLSNVEDEFMSYTEALTVFPMYMAAIKELKNQFSFLKIC